MLNARLACIASSQAAKSGLVRMRNVGAVLIPRLPASAVPRRRARRRVRPPVAPIATSARAGRSRRPSLAANSRRSCSATIRSAVVKSPSQSQSPVAQPELPAIVVFVLPRGDDVAVRSVELKTPSRLASPKVVFNISRIMTSRSSASRESSRFRSKRKSSDPWWIAWQSWSMSSPSTCAVAREIAPWR